VNYGAFNESFRQPVWVRIQSNFNGIAFDESGVMICDVERFSVRKAKPERFKWVAVYAVFKLLRVKHTIQAQSCRRTARNSIVNAETLTFRLKAQAILADVVSVARFTQARRACFFLEFFPLIL
jgi:hypothetical protein